MLHQVVSTLEPDDAVGNEVRLLDAALRRRCIASRILVAVRTGREPAEVLDLDDLLRDPAPAAVLYHVATASRATPLLVGSGLPLAVVYHNVTPPEFFWGVDTLHYEACLAAREDLRVLRDAARVTVAHSRFSRDELVALGFERTAVVPLLVDLAFLAGDGDGGAARSTTPVLLTVGRVAPHKCLEDAVRVLHALRCSVPDAQLWISGDATRLPTYAAAVRALAAQLGEQEHVRWLGAVPRDELARAYRSAWVYLSMSEHEGFGGPLLEAMAAGLPVLAHDAGAVAEILGGAGILMRGKDPLLAAELAGQLLGDDALRSRLAARGRARAAQLGGEGVVDALLDALRGAGLLGGVGL